MSAEQLFDQAPFGYLSTDPAGVVVRANQTVLRWTGRERSAVEGRLLTELLTPGAVLFYETQYAALLHAQGRVEGVSLDLVAADGSALPVLVSAEQQGDLVQVSLFSTRSRAAYEQELRRDRRTAESSVTRLRLLSDLREGCRAALDARDVVAALVRTLGLATRGGTVAVWLADDDGRLVLEAGAAGAAGPALLTGDEPLPAAEALRRGTAMAVGLDELRRDWPLAAAALQDAGREALLVAPLLGEDVVLGLVQVALRRDRPLGADDVRVLDDVGHEAGQALLRCVLPVHLRGLPLRDAVTGTATPALFGERMADALARGAAKGEPVTVLLLDVTRTPDDDGLPADLEDPEMAGLGARLRQVAGSDRVARVGRQRFAVLSEGRGVAEARGQADRLGDALSGVGAFDVTVGAAVVEPTVDGRSVTVGELLAWASNALDAARARGPGRRVVHGPANRQAARAMVDAERTLRRALDEDDVVLRYQPVVNLRTGRVVGVEALCRVRLPDGSLLLPAHFIDAAEDSGLVVPLGRRTLLLACEQQQTWARAGTSLDVSVNVAASQASAPGFADDVLALLAATGCPPQRLVLELTESALLTAAAATLRSFSALRAAGVRVALDDFGTRYASLDYVRSFPLDELKIDQSFVSGLPGSRVARAIVRMVARLADELDLVCVAEGIETAAQALFLRDLGVLGQGFALSEPVAAEEVVTWVTPTAWLASALTWEAGGAEPPSA